MSLNPAPDVSPITKTEWIERIRTKIETAWQKRPFRRVEDIFAVADLCATAQHNLPLADVCQLKGDLPFPAQHFSWLIRIADCAPLREIDPDRLPSSMEMLYMLATLDPPGLAAFCATDLLNRDLKKECCRTWVKQWKKSSARIARKNDRPSKEPTRSFPDGLFYFKRKRKPDPL